MEITNLQDPLGSVRSYGAIQRRRSRGMSFSSISTLREAPSVLNFHASRPSRTMSDDYRPVRLTRTLSGSSVDSSVFIDEEDYETLNAEEPTEAENDRLLLDNSPYAEVRACVSNRDDSYLEANTLRMWTIAMLFTVTGSAVNLFFSLRYPSISITALVAQLLSHPLGLAWTRYLPDKTINMFFFRVKLNDKTNPWNSKEHCCVFVASNVSFFFAFATDVLTEQIKFYGMTPSITYQILFIISTQIIGYTFAGLSRQWLIYPSSMIWPSTLVNCALFQVLHPKADAADLAPIAEEIDSASGTNVTRSKFFLIFFGIGFCWAFVPSFLFPALSYFSVVTWVAPENPLLNVLFGVKSGLGILPFTFDWSQIAFTGSPMLTPFWAQLNALAGIAVFLWIVAPVIYFTNTFYSGYMPFSDNNVFDNQGQYYNVSRIINSDFTFSLEKYKDYSPLYLPAAYSISFFASFAALTALIVHCILFYRTDIVRQWKASRTEVQKGTGDIHVRLMRRYPEVPMTWYLIIFLLCLSIAFYVVESYEEVGLPWYGLLLSLLICTIFFVPLGIITAVANQTPSTSLLCQIICGAVFPGRPIANMVFLTYGYISSMQGIKFAADMKIGTYMKVPPRLLFKVQLIATIVGSLTQVTVLNLLFAKIPKICQPDAPNGLTCPFARVHFNTSIIWGLVGPQRLFGFEQLYHPLIYAFILGALLPIPIWYLSKRKGSSPKGFWNFVNIPVMLGAMSWIPPASGLNFSSWALVGFLSNYVLKRRRPLIWAKFNFVLSAALDSSLAFALVIGFFALVYTGVGERINWWGTEVHKQTCDFQGCPRLKLKDGDIFGPEIW